MAGSCLAEVGCCQVGVPAVGVEARWLVVEDLGWAGALLLEVVRLRAADLGWAGVA